MAVVVAGDETRPRRVVARDKKWPIAKALFSEERDPKYFQTEKSNILNFV